MTFRELRLAAWKEFKISFREMIELYFSPLTGFCKKVKEISKRRAGN